jgi:hypothetical protein
VTEDQAFRLHEQNLSEPSANRLQTIREALCLDGHLRRGDVATFNCAGKRACVLFNNAHNADEVRASVATPTSLPFENSGCMVGDPDVIKLLT